MSSVIASSDRALKSPTKSKSFLVKTDVKPGYDTVDDGELIAEDLKVVRSEENRFYSLNDELIAKITMNRRPATDLTRPHIIAILGARYRPL
jgi:hypothetical protein